MSDKNYRISDVSSEQGIKKIQSISPNRRSNYFNSTQQKLQYNYYPINIQSKTEEQNKISQKVSEISIINPSQKIPTSQIYDQQLPSNNDPRNFLTQAEQLKYDLISTNQSKQNLLMIEKLLFYFNSQPQLQYFSNTQQYYVQNGKLYFTEFDNDMNPKFKIQEGSFMVCLSKKEFILHGNGKEYCGKSTLIKFQGQFENGIFKDDGRNQRSKSAPNKKIRIIDAQTGLQVNNYNQVNKYQNQSLFCESWCKYNQQISLKDIQILENNRRLTSSIIDAYVLYLNLESENTYFSQKTINRQNINRILFLPTTLTTNFGRNYTDQHTKDIFEAELLQFKDLNYDLKEIYSQIGMPVNKNNYHWYFLLFDLKQNVCTVFDSLQKPTTTDQMNIDYQLIITLEKLLKIEKPKRQFSECSGKQTDSYSCGYHVCQFMNYCQEKQFKQKVNHDFNLNEIKTKLLKIIKI
ncbi:unnamed protein product (macronuclear) [Paramecium tetraurelia]|uniref:Ubiquitin-like protease family profile domain-containing protein n=1 Tax=Paramecium tetraurelia TaxID=5888 RepID=A0C278_PARTE|nr:uncharacterized protein GSPATT00034372001 [Paramecium tetraurelia]CAK64895.1 unnamed protein product [Paramecium tetraurelia]|eukprot:XP_001432292.1 hypothetical protein (macronuclear) [Paramecium tetraurelia strain d4-2]